MTCWLLTKKLYLSVLQSLELRASLEEIPALDQMKVLNRLQNGLPDVFSNIWNVNQWWIRLQRYFLPGSCISARVRMGPRGCVKRAHYHQIRHT
jgi:hypothetical protein